MRRIVFVLVAVMVAGCGGGGGGKSSGSSVSVGAARACIEKAGFAVRSESHDASIGETAQLGVTEPDGPVTIAFMTDADAAKQYWEVVGGAENEGPEPGGNDQVGATVVQWYAKGAALTKIESCLSG